MIYMNYYGNNQKAIFKLEDAFNKYVETKNKYINLLKNNIKKLSSEKGLSINQQQSKNIEELEQLREQIKNYDAISENVLTNIKEDEKIMLKNLGSNNSSIDQKQPQIKFMIDNNYNKNQDLNKNENLGDEYFEPTQSILIDSQIVHNNQTSAQNPFIKNNLTSNNSSQNNLIQNVVQQQDNLQAAQTQENKKNNLNKQNTNTFS